MSVEERPHPVDREIGAAVRRGRRLRKLSQRTLAHEMGWYTAAVGLIETGEQSLRARDLGRLAEVLRCTVASLLPERWGTR